MDKYPELPEETWPELRKVKASNKTGWSYFEHLVKTMHKELGEERTAEVLRVFMRDNARRFLVPAMKGFGLDGNDAWSIASYFKLATGDIIGYRNITLRRLISLESYPTCPAMPYSQLINRHNSYLVEIVQLLRHHAGI